MDFDAQLLPMHEVEDDLAEVEVPMLDLGDERVLLLGLDFDPVLVVPCELVL